MKKTILSVVVAGVLISGCGSKTEETKTVDYYLQNDKEREETAKKCNNNYGELATTPNCINARQAAWQKTTTPEEPIDVNAGEEAGGRRF